MQSALHNTQHNTQSALHTLQTNMDNNAMLTLISNTRDEEGEQNVLEYTCDYIAEYNDKRVHVTAITVFEHDSTEHVDIFVAHDSDWAIYYDEEFEQAISSLLGYKVQFTEQGMQEDGYASME